MRVLLVALKGIILLFVIFWSRAMQAEENKYVLVDFEDVGSWRVGENNKKTPGTGFLQNYLNGSKNEKWNGQYVGELKFTFNAEEQAPFHLAAIRQKMSQFRENISKVEFYANGKGLPVQIRFVFLDAAKQRFLTAPIALDKSWQKYTLPLEPQTVPSWEKIKQPICLEKIVLQASAPCSGSVFLDDIALYGDFEKKNLCTISPIYGDIYYLPDSPAVLKYSVRNGVSQKKKIKVKISIQNFWKEPEGNDLEQILEVNGYGERNISFNIGMLPVGAYFAKVTAEFDDVRVQYEDYFGVFEPNGKRINRKPMWFGVHDTSNKQGMAESELHVDWMKKIGLDMNRFDITPNDIMFQYPVSQEGWKTLIELHRKNNVDVLPLYWETPRELFDKSKETPWRQPPVDYAAYQEYVAKFGKFVSNFSNIKYVEFWNEPDLKLFYYGDEDSFVKLSEAFYKGMKSTAPKVLLTSGSVTVIHPHEKKGFSQAMYDKCKDYYDIAAFHAHGPLQNYEERQLRVEKWMKAAGVNKPICNSETGERSIYTFDGARDQATTLVKKIAYAKSRPNSEFYIWFTLQDYWDMDPQSDDSFGLVNSDNRARPAFVAYNEIIRQLSNTDPAGELFLNDEVRIFGFQREDKKRVYVCWTKSGQANVLFWAKSSAPSIDVIDMFGRKSEVKNVNGVYPINVSESPLYIVSKKDLEECKQEERLIQVPLQILLRNDQDFSLPIRIEKNFAGKLDIELRNSNQQLLWQKTVNLKGADAYADTIRLDPSQVKNGLTKRLEISFVLNSNAKSVMKFPVTILDAYAIKKIEPLTSPLEYLSKAAANTSKIRLDQKKFLTELSFDPFIPAWAGEGDLSVEASLLHDSKGVFFYFDVRDDKHVPSSRANAPWDGDDVQIAVARADSSDCTQFDLALQADGQALVLCNHSPDSSLQGEWKVPVKIERKEGHTLYACYVPYEKLGLDYGNVSTSFRFTFLVNENDGQGRVRWMSWYDGIGRGRNVNLFGYALLE